MPSDPPKIDDSVFCSHLFGVSHEDARTLYEQHGKD